MNKLIGGGRGRREGILLSGSEPTGRCPLGGRVEWGQLEEGSGAGVWSKTWSAEKWPQKPSMALSSPEDEMVFICRKPRGHTVGAL